MKTVNIHEAKTHLSRIVEEAAKGKAFIIAKAGKPMAKITPLQEQETKEADKLGFMAGEIVVPDDFDTMASGEILHIFQGKSCETAS
ncbi:MAG: type II toxin-antitoxin system Phd/YefM family antitoxin [Acidobacteria bacterium]|nr:type II toxin-antitoxin system Phd/YefM family antitoxin [Acidobacteriota bacterium]